MRLGGTHPATHLLCLLSVALCMVVYPTCKTGNYPAAKMASTSEARSSKTTLGAWIAGAASA